MRRLGPLRLSVVPGILAAALAVAGCGPGGVPNNAAVTVSGKTLSIYASEPPGATGGQVATDVLGAERLALQQSGATVGSFRLRLQTLHDDTTSQDARTAVSDKTAIAYLGETLPGSSGVSVQITNELGLLQVSPTDTAAYLTQATPAVPDSPQHFYPAHANFHRTFARVVPTTTAEAKALVKRMGAEKVTQLAVADDGSDYGRSVAAQVQADAKAAGISAAGAPSSGAALFYGGTPSAAAAKAIDAAASAGARVFAPSGMYDDAFVGRLSAAAQRRLEVSAPGFLPRSAASVPARRAFDAAFEKAYGHAPAPQAVFGYEAMSALVAVLKQAGDHAAERAHVVDAFRGLHDRASALGTYSIDNGDTSIAPFVIAGVANGKLVPREQG